MKKYERLEEHQEHKIHKDYKQHKGHNIFTYTFKDYISFCAIHNLKTSRYNNLILFKRYLMEG